MSKRQLIFTSYQTLFSCKSDAFAEEPIGNACIHLDPDVAQDLPCCVYRTPETTDGKVVSASNSSVTLYEVLAREISDREISFESDILQAINGLLSMLHLETNVQFLCGLPVR